MKLGFELIFWIFRLTFTNRNNLVLENLALRQQLVVQQRSIKRTKLRNQDRFFWYMLSQLWNDWKSTLFIVKPETVVKWHRQGFKLYWRWKSRSKPGRPKVSKEIRDLIKRMAHENPTWGAPRIHAELQLLGYDIVESTISKYLVESQNHHRKHGRLSLKTILIKSSPLIFLQYPQ